MKNLLDNQNQIAYNTHHAEYHQIVKSFEKRLDKMKNDVIIGGMISKVIRPNINQAKIEKFSKGLDK